MLVDFQMKEQEGGKPMGSGARDVRSMANHLLETSIYDKVRSHGSTPQTVAVLVQMLQKLNLIK